MSFGRPWWRWGRLRGARRQRKGGSPVLVANFHRIFGPGTPTGIENGSLLDSVFNNPLWSNEDGIVATPGGTQATAYGLSATVSRVTVVAAGGDGVVLPPSTDGAIYIVVNGSPNPLTVFAKPHDTINGVDGGAGVSVLSGGGTTFLGMPLGKWMTLGGGGGGGGGGTPRSLVAAGAIPGTSVDNFTVIQNALSSGGSWTGEGQVFGVGGSITPQLARAASLSLVDTTLVQLTPQAASVRTLQFLNSSGTPFVTGPLSLGNVWVRLSLDTVDARPFGAVGNNAGMHISGINGLNLSYCGVEGNGHATGMRVVDCSNITNIRPTIKNMSWYQLTDPGIEQIVGIFYIRCTDIYTLFPRLVNLTGKFGDATAQLSQYWAYQTDGLDHSQSTNSVVIAGKFENIGEGSDISGGEPGGNLNIKFIGCDYNMMSAYGWKLAHGKRYCSIDSTTARNCGINGFFINPSVANAVVFGARSSECVAVNVGGYTYPDGSPTFGTTAGFSITGVAGNEAPKGTLVSNFQADSDLDDNVYGPVMEVWPGQYTNYSGNGYRAADNPWVGPGIAYSVGDVRSFEGAYYSCQIANVSTAYFRADERAGYWTLGVRTTGSAGWPGSANPPVHTSGTVQDAAGIPWKYIYHGITSLTVVSSGSGLDGTMTLTIGAPDQPGFYGATASPLTINTTQGTLTDTVVSLRGEGYSVAPPVTARANGSATGTTNAVTTSGAVLHFAAVPDTMANGLWVADSTAPGSITTGTKVLSFTATTVTLDASVAGTVGSGDTITFTTKAVTNNTTAPGNAVLHFASVPATVLPGMVVTDVTTPGAITAGTKVLSKTSNTVTMDTVAAGGGVGNGDTMNFAAVAPSLTANLLASDQTTLKMQLWVQLGTTLNPFDVSVINPRGRGAIGAGLYGFQDGSVWQPPLTTPAKPNYYLLGVDQELSMTQIPIWSPDLPVDHVVAYGRAALTLTAGLNSNVALGGSSFYVLNNPGNCSIEGFIPSPTDLTGQQRFSLQWPHSTNTLTIVDSSNASIATPVANRITVGGQNVIIGGTAGGQTILDFCYLGASSQWILENARTSGAIFGTFVANGATPVTVANIAVTANSIIWPTLKTVGGTVGAVPAIQTITPGTGFTVAATAGDTSTYNYRIM